MYKVGDYVTWTSQANGNSVCKVGDIVGELPAYTDPWKILSELAEKYNLSIASGDGGPKAHRRYFVRVMGDPGKKGKLYLPKVANLHPYYRESLGESYQ